MKPRLPTAPWTKEDSDILWRIIVRGRWCGQSRTNIDYRPADRRDADLVAEVGYIREMWRPKNLHWCAVKLHGIACGGFHPEWCRTGDVDACDITNFA